MFNYQTVKCSKYRAGCSTQFQSCSIESEDQKQEEQHIWDEDDQIPYPNPFHVKIK